MILHIISICAYLLVSTCAYITQLLFAGVAICYTKNLSSFDWMRVMFHSHGGLEVGTSTKKMGDSQKSEIFPSKKKTEGGRETRHHQTKKTPPYPPTKTPPKNGVFGCETNRPPQKKNHRGKIPQVFMAKNLQFWTPNLQELLQGFLCERIILLFLEKWRRPLLSDKNQRWDVGDIWWKMMKFDETMMR